MRALGWGTAEGGASSLQSDPLAGPGEAALVQTELIAVLGGWGMGSSLCCPQLKIIHVPK